MSLLCLVNEVGAAAYLAPLWRRYLARGDTHWAVSAPPLVSRWLRREAIAIPRWVEPNSPDAVTAWIAQHRPACVVMSATHHETERAAIELCRELSIATIGVVDTWINYRFRFDWDAAGLCMPDAVLMIDAAAVAEATAEGLDPTCLQIIGQPAWEQAVGQALPPARASMFVSQPLAERYGNRLGYDEFDAWALVKSTARRVPDLFGPLLYAAHPVGAVPDDADLDGYPVTTNGPQALATVDVVLGMSSSLMVDALLMGRAVVSVQPDARGPNMDPLSRHGRIPIVGSSQELEAVLRAARPAASDLGSLLAGSLQRLDEFVCARMNA